MSLNTLFIIGKNLNTLSQKSKTSSTPFYLAEAHSPSSSDSGFLLYLSEKSSVDPPIMLLAKI